VHSVERNGLYISYANDIIMKRMWL